MHTPPPPPDRQPAPARNGTDVVVSILALSATLIVGAAGAVMGVFSLAFLDYCPPQSCSVDGAVTVVLTTIVVAGLTGLAGLVLTVIRIRKRTSAWPYAAGTLALVIAVLFFGALAYTRVVGY